MKHISLTFALITFSLTLFGQTGIYKSNHYEFKNELNPSKNNIQYDTKVLIIDFDATMNKYLIWRVTDSESGEQYIYKWNIKSIVDSKLDKSKNILQTIYSAKWVIEGVEAGDLVYIYKIDDLNDKSLNIIIYSTQKTQMCFYNLKSL